MIFLYYNWAAFIVIFMTIGDSTATPSVRIVLPLNSDKDFQNDTYLATTNANMFFELHCTAPYPIQWVCFFEPDDDGNSAKEKWAETRRSVGRFEDPATYTYTAILSLTYSGKLHVFTNFSCQAIEDWTEQSNVIMTAVNRKDVVHLATTSSVLLRKEPAQKQDSCPTVIIASRLEDDIGCWKCETSNGDRLQLDVYTCKTPIECNMFYHRSINRKCLRINPKPFLPGDKWDGCSLTEEDYSPTLIVCKNNGVALVNFHYFSVVLRENGNPYIYFAWEDIDPQKMLKIHPIGEILFVGDEVTIICELSEFYFSAGVWFAIEMKEGDSQRLTYIEAVEPPGRSEIGRDKDDVSGTFLRNFTLTVEKDMRGIYCFGPIWNSRAWVNASLAVMVEEGVAPSVVNPVKDMEISTELGEINYNLRCTFGGKPFPNIEWSGPKQSVYNVKTNDTEMWSEIRIKEVTHASEGKYVCTGTSFKGKASRSFTLTVSDSYKSTLTIASAVIIPILIGIIIIIIIGWRKIKQQRNLLRLLTEAEVKEFVEGNPKLIKSDDFIDGAIAIDALPFDQKKFEIPFERLEIDFAHLLGSGAFGEVYRGKIKPSGRQDKDSPCESTRRASAPPPYVAIKTVKQNVDVENFKALLGEIKIMAFLGEHKNVVCLIGATTENIRNRQAWIAVEFCENGSLDKYLQNSRSSFINYVRYGYLDSRTSTSPSPGIGDYGNVFGHSVSTYDLLKFAYDIASGMEYLNSKKVIHGDLALRNVLLTSESTCKIGDFGLSRQLINSANYFKKTYCPLPWKWMAPESLTEMRFSVYSDIWAYGVTLWELFTLADSPYKGYAYNKEFLEEIQNGLRLDKPIYATNHVHEYMLKCWKLIPEQRPPLSEMKRIVADLLKDIVPEGYFDFQPQAHAQNSNLEKLPGLIVPPATVYANMGFDETPKKLEYANLGFESETKLEYTNLDHTEEESNKQRFSSNRPLKGILKNQTGDEMPLKDEAVVNANEQKSSHPLQRILKNQTVQESQNEGYEVPLKNTYYEVPLTTETIENIYANDQEDRVLKPQTQPVQFEHEGNDVPLKNETVANVTNSDGHFNGYEVPMPLSKT